MSLVILLFAAALTGEAQAADPDMAVRRADDAFWTAYNACDSAIMADAFTEDAEFYHDITGLTRGRTAVVESLMQGPCGTEGQRLRREVVAGSVEAHPLAGPYRLLSGEHVFFVQRPGEPDRASAVARFIDIWKQEDGQWRMARVVSYDHRPPPFTPPAIDPAFDRSRLPALAGRYLSNGFGDILIEAASDHLRLASGDLVLELFPVAGDRFAARDRDIQIEFDAETLTVFEAGAPVTTARRAP